MTRINAIHVKTYIIAIFTYITFTIFLAHTYLFSTPHPHLSNIPVFEKTFERPSKSILLHINETIKRLGAAKQIYIINLSYRTDRRIRSIALFQTLHLDAFIVPAYSIHSPEVVSRTYLVNKGYVTLMELACWASHMRIWLEIASSENNDSWALVFEDDIDLEMATFDILESLPKDLWNIPDMIYLGHCGDPPGPVIFEAVRGYRIHRAIYPSCTHAYAIRSHAASKLIHLLSSPRRALDDELVRLVNNKKILAFSFHPPLALQQSITSSSSSDVNPIKHTLVFQIQVWFSYIRQWWRGVEFIDQLNVSALAQADFIKADTWRRNTENEIW